MPAILNIAQRRKRAIQFRRIKQRIKQRKKILSRRVATGDRLRNLPDVPQFVWLEKEFKVHKVLLICLHLKR